jgi:hypothetical protein
MDNLANVLWINCVRSYFCTFAFCVDRPVLFSIRRRSFFAIAAVVSFVFNLWQLFRDHYKYTPLKDSLIGLFNDLKGRQLRAYQRQHLITSKASMSLPAEAIRLGFYDFVQETTQSLEQLREHVVASIHVLDPDASTQQVFRAAEFGLTEQERQFRQEGMERLIRDSRASRDGSTQDQSSSQVAPTPSDQHD